VSRGTACAVRRVSTSGWPTPATTRRLFASAGVTAAPGLGEASANLQRCLRVGLLVGLLAAAALHHSSPWPLADALAIPAAVLISQPFWRRRSLALLPVVMLFPYVALNDGMNVMGFDGDFWNLVQVTGMSAIPFLVLGGLIAIVGIVSWLAILPLAGLEPQDRKPLFVLPAAMFLWAALSQLVALVVVPGSPIDAEYFLGREILASANSILMMTLIGALLAVIYVTLWRLAYPRLPAWLRTETVALTWKDLRVPALLAAVSVILGLLIIT